MSLILWVLILWMQDHVLHIPKASEQMAISGFFFHDCVFLFLHQHEIRPCYISHSCIPGSCFFLSPEKERLQHQGMNQTQDFNNGRRYSLRNKMDTSSDISILCEHLSFILLGYLKSRNDIGFASTSSTIPRSSITSPVN
jgi:hypothetical protein